MSSDSRQNARLRNAPVLPLVPGEPSLAETFRTVKGGLGYVFEAYDRKQQEKSAKLSVFLSRVQEALLTLAGTRSGTSDPRKAWYSVKWTRAADGRIVGEGDGASSSGYVIAASVTGFATDPASGDTITIATYTGPDNVPSAVPVAFGTTTLSQYPTDRKIGYPAAVKVSWSATFDRPVRFQVFPAATYGFQVDRDVTHASRMVCAAVPGENAYYVHLRAEPSYDGEDVSAVEIPIGRVYCEIL